MIIAGKSRGNGKQLAGYLLKQGQNDNAPKVLEVRGSASNNARYAILEMSLQAELNRRPGQKGLYHAHISPAIGEDKLTPEQWQLAANSLEKELGLEGQNRVIVLHEKHGRLHGHIVWQRSKDGRFIGDGHNYRNHDKARAELERQLGHKRTLQPGEAKHELTNLWQQCRTGAEFVKAAEARGYRVAQGERRAFTVETPDGQKIDLVRQLQGVKTKEARSKLADITPTLPHEKDLIGQARVSDRQQKKRSRDGYDPKAARWETERKRAAGQKEKEGRATNDSTPPPRQPEPEKQRQQQTKEPDLFERLTRREETRAASRNGQDIGKDTRPPQQTEPDGDRWARLAKKFNQNADDKTNDPQKEWEQRQQRAKDFADERDLFTRLKEQANNPRPEKDHDLGRERGLDDL